MTAPTTERVRAAYGKMAAGYDREMRFFERIFAIRPGRAWACGGASGKVLELAIGTGRNLPFYGFHVDLTGVDLSPAMLAIARERAASLGLTVELQEADATALPFPDGHFDTIVCTLALCTIPEPVAAVREAVRVCKPDGQLRFFEHGLASSRVVAWGERLLEPLTLRFQADRLTVQPENVMTDGGAQVVEVQRANAGIYWHLLARPSSSAPPT
jgi:ubiquinone/menaquinone biosynthesis C-methylase UbiE